MSKKLIHLGPLALIIMGFFWSMHINLGATFLYNLGFGCGLFLIPAIPAIILAGVHKSFSKKKAIENAESGEVKMKRTSYMLLFSTYCTLLGIILFVILLVYLLSFLGVGLPR